MKKKRDNTKTTLQQEAEFILETAIQRADINKKELQKPHKILPNQKCWKITI